jgi:hypothetical protein
MHSFFQGICIPDPLKIIREKHTTKKTLKNESFQEKKVYGLIVAHTGGHTAHTAAHTTHATGWHATLGCMALGRCNDIVNTQDHDSCFCS